MTIQGKAPTKMMILHLGYDSYVVPAALQDKIHILLQLQKIGSSTVKRPTKDGYDWQNCHYYSSEKTSVEQIVPDYIFKDQQAMEKYADEMKEAIRQIDAAKARADSEEELSEQEE